MPILTSVVPWTEICIDASRCQSADEVYERIRTSLGALLVQNRERVMAIRLKISGATSAHAELSRDLDQVRNEVISVANECGNGLLWVERVQVETVPTADRAALLTRDDPVGEIVRMAATFQGDPEAIANISSIQELQKKLPVELSEGTDPITLDRTTLTAALQEGEELLLARLSALELR